MKSTKKILAILTAIAIMMSSCVIVSASASVSMGVAASFSVENGVDYAKYSVYGSQSGHTESATVLEFNPADGYIPMAFAAYAGTASTLRTHYNMATNKYGYDVAGVINGSYFATATGTLTGILVSGGKFACADIGYTYGTEMSVVAFDKNGNMNVVDSMLKYELYVNGTLVPDALRYINKRQSADSWRTDAVFYYDSSCGTTADSSYTGYEVLCQKNSGSELKIGQTMNATVVQVNSGTCGTKFGSDSYAVSDRFVLSVKSGSSYASYLSGLKAGDTVQIAIEETVTASKSVMENAESVITNVGMLVKDGVDQTDLYTTIGDHNVKTTYARWTAFGQKPDGTYVYFTSEGGDTGNSSRSLTLKDVAAAMIKLGCTNVVRLDGGGSSAMYVSNTGSGSAGYVQSSSRAVADCLMIVKKPVEIPTLDSGDPFWLTHYNDISAEGAGAVMTKSYSGGAWNLHIAFSPVSGTNAYEITAISDGTVGGKGSALAVPDGGFVYSLNYGNDYVSLGWGSVDYTSDACSDMIARAKTWAIGDRFVFGGLDLSASVIPTSTPSVNWYEDSYVCTALIASTKMPAFDGDTFWVTHFNNVTAEGAGAIMTKAYTGGAWNLHVAFSPVADYTYVITAISDGTASGAATPLAIPDGGFVYTINRGNDYISLGAGDTDFTSDACDTMIAAVKTWSVGDRFVFGALDLEGQVIPTSTAGTNWYEDSYVCTAVYKRAAELLWVTHYNDISAEGAGSIMTKSYTGGAWNLHIAFAPVNGTSSYEIVAISDGTVGGTGKALAIPTGGFVYTLNYGNDYISLGTGDADFTSDACDAMIAKALTWAIGDRFVFDGIDLDGLTVPTSTSGTKWYADGYVCTASFTADGQNAAPFAASGSLWVTHYNDITVEGAGSIMTKSYTGGAWNLHIAFAPVEGSAAYEITAISNGTEGGTGTALAIPSDGFVYTLNYGNDYISLGWGDTDFTSEACDAMIAAALTWTVGDQFVLSGVDLDNLTVPTTTSSLNWYDDGYVCTATYAY